MAKGAHAFFHYGLVAAMVISLVAPATAQLSVSFYANTCPNVFSIVRAAVQSAVNREARMGASLMRLFFHDCFVNGCEASILLDDTSTFTGEKSAPPNQNSVRGYEVIDNIKSQLNQACGNTVVSCADIVAIAARDSVVALGGPSYSIPVGRRDARTADQAATSDLPSPFEDLDAIIKKFSNKGFTTREMVALSGAHTVGFARCVLFRTRIYNETNIDASFAASLQQNCPATAGGSADNNLAPLDPQSPNRFGNNYFQALINKRGLLHSDQVLFNGGAADSFVTTYSNNQNAFNTDFANAMAKMGSLSVLTGASGEVRVSCRKPN